MRNLLTMPLFQDRLSAKLDLLQAVDLVREKGQVPCKLPDPFVPLKPLDGSFAAILPNLAFNLLLMQGLPPSCQLG